jgi:hypothetical protein
MALPYTTIQAIINDKYLPAMYNQIFTDNHYLLYLLKQKAKTFNERQIVVPLEYNRPQTSVFMDRYGKIAVGDVEIATAAAYTPKMFTNSISIPLEDELMNMSDMAILNLTQAKVKNLRRAMQEDLADHLWTRGTSLSATKNWNTIDFLVNNSATQSVGGVIDGSTVPTWWKSNMIDMTTDSYYAGCDTASKVDDLINPNKNCYLKKLLQRGIAKSKYLTGETPDCCVVPQFIWDLIEIILDPQKTGSALDEELGSMGFDALKYRSLKIVADDDMVAKQTGDTDGRMYFFNTNYLYMFFNSGAKFKATAFVRAHNANVMSSLVNAFGNIAISNRAVQTCIYPVYSPKTYAAA